jgi:general secretion pathway protein A
VNAAELEHFDLHAIPFDKNIGAKDLWLPPATQDVIDQIVDAVRARQWAMITGEPGGGKTSALRVVRELLAHDGYRLTYSHNTTLGRRDFYRQVCHALSLNPKATAAAVFYAITTHVTELTRERIQPVLFIDEAHLLHQDVLDHLHILGNYEWDQAPLLTIILSGLPELEDRLALRRNRSLYSRLHRRLHLTALEPSDTANYIQHRLERAGGKRDYFSTDALGLLHEASGGNLRDLDRIAAAAMRAAARAGKRLVERDAVSLAVRHDSIHCPTGAHP